MLPFQLPARSGYIVHGRPNYSHVRRFSGVYGLMGVFSTKTSWFCPCQHGAVWGLLCCGKCVMSLLSV